LGLFKEQIDYKVEDLQSMSKGSWPKGLMVFKGLLKKERILISYSTTSNSSLSSIASYLSTPSGFRVSTDQLARLLIIISLSRYDPFRGRGVPPGYPPSGRK
jgi:hypothetical protein